MTQAPSPEGLRYDYESTLLSLATLEAKYGLSRGEITAMRIAEKWTPRESNVAALNAYRLASAVSRLEIKSTSPQPDDTSTPAARAPASEGEASQPSPPKSRRSSKTGGTPQHRKSLITRLYDLFDAKISEIEARVASHTPLARPDNESEVRAFGQFIKYFESLTDLSDAELKAAQTSAATDITRDDTERLRQNLVERLEKLRPTADPTPVAPTVAE